MKRRYYVHYYQNFRNTYELYYTENERSAEKMEAMGMQRITRREAVQLCIEEKYRRKYDRDFAYRADASITPWETHNIHDYVLRYYVWEKRK